MFLIHQSRLSNTASPCDHLWEKKKETKEEKERGAVERERERERTPLKIKIYKIMPDTFFVIL